MLLYKKIFVPHDVKLHGVCMDSNYHVSYEGFMGPTGPPTEVVPMLNVIVLTLEEAHDLFIAGMRRQRWVKESLDGEIVKEHPDFLTHLQSKGINNI